MSNTSISLAGARAFLQMNIKPVAQALRMSDKTLTRLEKDADPDDPKVAELVQFYEDLGLRFLREDGEIVGIRLSDEVKRLIISAQRYHDPDTAIEELRRRMRHIAGLVYDLKLENRNTAALNDTMIVHFPVPVRDIAMRILSDMIGDGYPLTIIDDDGKPVDIAPDTSSAGLD